jgi:hypothetical protein
MSTCIFIYLQQLCPSKDHQMWRKTRKHIFNFLLVPFHLSNLKLMGIYFNQVTSLILWDAIKSYLLPIKIQH